MLRFIIAPLVVLGLILPQARSQETGSPLTVCTKTAPPFSMKNDRGEWNGLTISLWEQIAENLNGAKYSLVEKNLDSMVSGLSQGECDVSLGALTITADREREIDFSHPYMNSGLGIAVMKEGNSYLAILSKVFTWQFFVAVLSLAILLLVVGALLWIVERHRNREQFGGSTIEGLGSAFWWSAVTMTTVGYGDKAPTTFAGRFIGLIWMFASVIIISTFTAAIASSLTVQSMSTAIENPSDLYRASVGTVGNSASSTYLDNQSIRHTAYTNLGEAFAALKNGDIEAVVYDKPLLQYMTVSDEKYGGVGILPFELTKNSYGIGLAKNSPLRNMINIELLTIINSKKWKDQLAESFGEDDTL